MWLSNFKKKYSLFDWSKVIVAKISIVVSIIFDRNRQFSNTPQGDGYILFL